MERGAGRKTAEVFASCSAMAAEAAGCGGAKAPPSIWRTEHKLKVSLISET